MKLATFVEAHFRILTVNIGHAHKVRWPHGGWMLEPEQWWTRTKKSQECLKHKIEERIVWQSICEQVWCLSYATGPCDDILYSYMAKFCKPHVCEYSILKAAAA